MNRFRIALANIRFPATPEESVAPAEQAIAQASIERAWSAIAAAAAKATLALVLGTERVVDDALFATALVIDRDGTIAAFQDKVQLDPSEDSRPGHGFRARRSGGPGSRPSAR